MRTAASTGDVPVFGCLLDAQRVASVETHAETQETIQWKKKTCNVYCSEKNMFKQDLFKTSFSHFN